MEPGSAKAADPVPADLQPGRAETHRRPAPEDHDRPLPLRAALHRSRLVYLQHQILHRLANPEEFLRPGAGLQLPGYGGSDDADQAGEVVTFLYRRLAFYAIA